LPDCGEDLPFDGDDSLPDFDDSEDLEGLPDSDGLEGLPDSEDFDGLPDSDDFDGLPDSEGLPDSDGLPGPGEVLPFEGVCSLPGVDGFGGGGGGGGVVFLSCSPRWSPWSRVNHSPFFWPATTNFFTGRGAGATTTTCEGR
jgi:hypothetical protein